MKVLFVCSFGRDRSPTAAGLYHGLEGWEARSGGLHARSQNPVTEKKLRWADVIVTFMPDHTAELRRRFGPLLDGRRIECLEIANTFTVGAPLLKDLIAQRMQGRLVGLPTPILDGRSEPYRRK